MTSLLKDTLIEHATAEDAPDVDLDAIIRTGDRRRRRHRVLAGLTVATAVLAVVVAGTPVLDRTTTHRPAGSPASFAERKVTWASGSTIHYGERDIPVGPATVAAFVQTDSGFVLTDPEGVVYVADWRAVTRIGAGNRSLRLSADDTGSWVGWVDHTARVPEFVVYDVASRREVLRTADGNTTGMKPWPAPNAPTAVDIDAGHAYFAAADGLRRWNIENGRGELLERGLTGENVADVAAGKIAVKRRDGTEVHLVVSADLNAREPSFDGWSGSLSPGAEHLVTDRADVQVVYSVERRGVEMVRGLRHSEHPLYVPTQWLDDVRFVAVGIRDRQNNPQMQPVDLIICSIDAGCQVAVPAFAPYPKDGERPGFQLPIGRTFAAY